MGLWTPLAERVVSGLIAALPSDLPDYIRSRVDRLGALPIGPDMWADYYLRPTGEVVVVGEDIDYPDVEIVYSDCSRVLRVLVWGSERYPALRQLLPERAPGAIDCKCRTIPIFAEGKVLCPECGGLG